MCVHERACVTLVAIKTSIHCSVVITMMVLNHNSGDASMTAYSLHHGDDGNSHYIYAHSLYEAPVAVCERRKKNRFCDRISLTDRRQQLDGDDRCSSVDVATHKVVAVPGVEARFLLKTCILNQVDWRRLEWLLNKSCIYALTVDRKIGKMCIRIRYFIAAAAANQ